MISLSTACLYHLPLRSTLRLAADVGFDGAELVMGPAASAAGPASVLSLVREIGLPVLTVHQTLLPRRPRGSSAGRLLEAADMASGLGASHVVVHLPAADSWSKPEARDWLEALEACQRRLEGSGTRIAVENWGVGPPEEKRFVLRDLAELREFAEANDLDITFDACHAGIEGYDLFRAYDLLAPRVANIHLSNLRKASLCPPPLRFLLTEHRLPDDGVLPLAGLISYVCAQGYRGPFTYEISPLALGVWSRQTVCRRLGECLAFARAHMECERPTV